MDARGRRRLRVLLAALGLAALTLAVAGCTSTSSTKTQSTAAGNVALTPCGSKTPTSVVAVADALVEADQADAAKSLYEAVLRDAHASAPDKACAARGLAAIANAPAPPKSAQQRSQNGWDKAFKRELRPLQNVVVPMLIVLAALLALSRFGTPVLVGSQTPGPNGDGRGARGGLGSVYWWGVAMQAGAACLGVLAVARAGDWSSHLQLVLALVAGGVIVVGVGAGIVLLAVVGRKHAAKRVLAAFAVVCAITVPWWLVLLFSGHLHGRPSLLAYSALAGLVGVALVGRVRGLANRVQVQGRSTSGADDAGAADRVRLRLQDLGSRPAAGLELPEQTDVTKLPDDAITLLPDGAFAKAVFRVLQTFLPASPWRVTVVDLGDDRLGVTIVRNGRMVSATVVHGSDLGLPRATGKDAVRVPAGLLDVGAAAFVLAELAQRYAYLDDGLSGATRWSSIAAQAAATDPSLSLDDEVKRSLIAHAIEVDPQNSAARLAFYYDAYRRADSAEEALTYATGLTTLAEQVDLLRITITSGGVDEAGLASEGWTALQLRVLYNLAVAWLNRFLLLPKPTAPTDEPAWQQERLQAWRRADGAARATQNRLVLQHPKGLHELVEDFKPATELTLGTITAEGLRDGLASAQHPVPPGILHALLSITTTYDRACYRVATRQADDALHDLEVATANPDLRTWARTDPSMQWLREHATAERRFRKIVGEPAPAEFVQLPPWRAYATKLTAHGLTGAAELFEAAPPWVSRRLGVSPTLATRWRESAAVALTSHGGEPLPTGTVFLLLEAGIDTREALGAALARTDALVTRLATAARPYDVDVPTVAEIAGWSTLP